MTEDINPELSRTDIAVIILDNVMDLCDTATMALRRNYSVRFCVSAGVALLALAAGPAVADPASITAKVWSSGGALGDPDLFNAQVGLDNRRIAITPNGKKTNVFAEEINVSPGDIIRVRTDQMLTKCHNTDYNPPDGKRSGCEGTHQYAFSPVSIKGRILLTNGRRMTTGVEFSNSAGSTSCNDTEHHCVLTAQDSYTVQPGDVPAGGASRWVVLQVEASNSNARLCTAGQRPNGCDVLDVETLAGRMAVTRLSEAVESDQLEDSSSRRVTELEVANTDAERLPKRRVVYSLKLNDGQGISSLVGDQFEVEGKLRVDENRPYHPLISSYLILAASPNETKAGTRASDARFISFNNGENCEGTCTFIKPGGVETITDCDVAKGRRYLNLVAGAVRTIPQANGDKVDVLNSGYLRTERHYDGDVGPSPAC